jgi:hypothetical protein
MRKKIKRDFLVKDTGIKGKNIINTKIPIERAINK